MALVPPVQVELRPLGKVQGKEEKRSEVVEAPRGQVHLVDELPVVHQEVELEAVEVDPLAGDEAPVGLVREEAGAGGADVLAGGEGKVSKAYAWAWWRCFQTWARRWRRGRRRG
ncbi:hypothetical protein TthTF19_02840 [Thermus thermophilus]